MRENDSSSSDFQPSITSLWDDLKQLTKEVVAAMNLTDDLRRKTGGLEYRMAAADEIVISNQISPSMDVTICLRSAAIQVHTRIIVEGINAAERESWESFTTQTGETETFLPARAPLRNQEGEVFTIEQAVYHLLRRFLHLRAIAN